MQSLRIQSGKGPGRNTLRRIYQIDSLIRNGRYPNVPELAKKLETCTRTIEKDLEYLKNFFAAPLQYCHKKRGYYYTERNFMLPQINFTEGEIVALFLGQKLLSRYRGTPYEESIRFAFEKIARLLPEHVSVDLELFDQAVTFDVEPVRGEEPLLLERCECLISALKEKRSVVADYYSAHRNARSRRMIDPYHLLFKQGVRYLIGYCHNRHEVLMFALDRMERLEITERRFAPAPDFSIERYLGDSLSIERGSAPVEVKILFDRHQARWICERRWHASQQLEKQPDGSVLLSITVSGLGEVKRWVLSFGGHAEVLAPVELREEVKREIDGMGRRYR
jgi:predicted DNA-binding transcriptional regulator YafY